jgi:hypothetical protein
VILFDVITIDLNSSDAFHGTVTGMALWGYGTGCHIRRNSTNKINRRKNLIMDWNFIFWSQPLVQLAK